MYVEQPHADLPEFVGRFFLNSNIGERGWATVGLMCCYRTPDPSGYICQGLVDEIPWVGSVEKDGDAYVASVRRYRKVCLHQDEYLSERLSGRFRTCRDALLAIADEFPTLGFG